MPNALVDILTQGKAVDVDLLSVLPASTSSLTWQTPNWPGYAPKSALPLVVARELPGGLAFSIDVLFRASQGVWPVAAVGVSYQGSTLFVAPFEQTQYFASDLDFPVRITGLVNPVQL